MRSSSFRLSVLLASAFLFLLACNTTSSEIQPPPELPPVESASVDLSEMEQVSAKSLAEEHFNTALFTAGVAKVIIEANLAIPKVLITAAQNQSVETLNENEWEWNYSVAANGNNFSVRLTASLDNSDQVTWNFYVSNSALGLDNAKLFTGSSDYEGTMGTWTYFSLLDGREVSEVTWERTDEITSVRVEVKSDRNDNLGDTISYDFDGTIKTLVFTDVSEGEVTTISFNIEDRTGFIISPSYNEGAKSCWDQYLNNTTCTA